LAGIEVIMDLLAQVFSLCQNLLRSLNDRSILDAAVHVHPSYLHDCIDI
jgi:hypothetical protein